MSGWSRALTERILQRLTLWPEAVTETIDLGNWEAEPSPTVPEAGRIVVYVHGFLGEGRVEAASVGGANQAAALRAGLAEEFADRTDSPPTVVAGMWNSSTTWARAKVRADSAGATMATWLQANAGNFESVTLLGHSLGGRVALSTLRDLDGTTVDSVGLLGAAVDPDRLTTGYREGIERSVDGGVFNYHSRDDAIVCYFYGAVEGHSGLGCTGATATIGGSHDGRLPRNYTDVDVSGQVRGHMDYLLPVAETKGGNCLGAVRENQLTFDGPR